MRTANKKLRAAGLLCILCVTLLVLQGCEAKDTSSGALVEAVNLMEVLAYGEAIAVTDAVIAENGPEMREAYRLKGIALVKSGQYEEADEAFLQALALSDGTVTDMDFDISMYRALAFRKRGLYRQAGEIYDNILALRANDAAALYAKGCNLLGEDRISDAYRCFDEARKNAGGSEELQELYVLIYRALSEAGYREAGLNQLEAALKDPQLSQADQGRFLYYLGRTDTEEGLSPVEQYNRTGMAHMARGEYEQATEVFETGLSLQEEDMQQALQRNRIAAYEYAGNFGMAAQLAEAYLTRYPEDTLAARELVFLRTR